MPQLDHDQVIRQYWLEVKDKYPDLTYEQFKEICKSPFAAIKVWIKSGFFFRILVKYLGKFKVSGFKAKEAIATNQRRFDKGDISEVQYLTDKKYYEEYLRDVESSFEDTVDEVNLIDDEDDKEETP